LFRCPSQLPALLLAVSLCAPRAARCDAPLIDVSGGVLATQPRLEVRVKLTNRGAQPAASIEVRGELLGQRREVRLAGTLAPGSAGSVTLDFEPPTGRPGRHVLALLIEHPVDGAPDAAGNPEMASARAYLMLALGADAGEAVRLEADPLALHVRGRLGVRLESRDASAHRVALEALTARGLRPDGPPLELEVPAHGVVRAELPVAVAGEPRERRQALLLVARNLDGPLARTSVTAASVEIEQEIAWLPRLRVPLVVSGLGLVLLALVYEWRGRRGVRGVSPA
jgi:hypothetical protein